MPGKLRIRNIFDCANNPKPRMLHTHPPPSAYNSQEKLLLVFPLAKGGAGGRCGASLPAQPREQAPGAQNHPWLPHPKNEAVGRPKFLPRELIDFGRGFCTVFGRKQRGWVINGLETCGDHPRSSFYRDFYFFSFWLRASHLWEGLGGFWWRLGL